MRIDPSGTVVAFTHGYGGGPLSVRVVDLASGAQLAELPAGHDPRWLSSSALLARSPSGDSSDAESGGFVIGYVGANQSDLDARGGRAAFTPDRSIGVGVYVAGALVQRFPSTFEPSLSAGGTLALRDLSSGLLRLERLAGCADAAAIDPHLGAATRPRWSSQTIVHDSVPFGRVAGRTTPDQPTIDVTVPGRSCVFPVPCWTGLQLVIAFVLDDGILAVADWAALQAPDPHGWIIGTSGGSAFDWDTAIVPGQPSRLRVAYLTPAGELAVTTLDLASPTQPLTTSKPPDPEPPDPPDPPEPEPPDPPTPDPPQPPEESTVPNVSYDELRNMEMRLEDTYWNHGHHPITVYEIHVNPEGLIWRQHYWERRAEGMPHEQAIRWVESQIDLIEGRPDRWAPVPPEPLPPGTVRGPITVEGRHFSVPD